MPQNIPQKPVLICDFGEWGFMDRSKPCDVHCYNVHCKIFQEELERRGFSSVIVKSLPNSLEEYYAVVFVTRGEVGTARTVKKDYPDIHVIVLTGAPPYGEEDGVVIVDKSILLDWVEKASMFS
ncbi:MAG: hypothetical protein HGA67_03140 [Candidatus Yonathbacteria bacterium]|nr:hypothetical protein [Candidatus Yonathbacteria bacterium]